MPRATADLLTPALLVDVDCARRNLARMQEYCTGHRLALRPHVKTHKLPLFAREQLARGAAGITCQKLGEAEVMVDAGCDDILLSYEVVGERNLLRLGALARRCRLATIADSRAVVDGLAWAAARAGVDLPVLVDGDAGYGRTGIAAPHDAVALAEAVASTPGLRFAGLFTYPTLSGTRDWLRQALQGLARSGLAAPVVSSGGTPGALATHEVPEITELRVGTYIYNDRTMVRRGAAAPEDCALSVLATVISAHAADRVILDAGSKALTSDLVQHEAALGHGDVLGYPGALVGRLYEEHAVCDMRACAALPRVGDRVRVVPNHACAAVNLYDEVALVRGDEVLDILPVAARGRSR